MDTAPLVLLIVIGRKPFHEPNVSPDAVSMKYVRSIITDKETKATVSNAETICIF